MISYAGAEDAWNSNLNENNVSACFSEGENHGLTNAAGATSTQGGLSAEVEHAWRHLDSTGSVCRLNCGGGGIGDW